MEKENFSKEGIYLAGKKLVRRGEEQGRNRWKISEEMHSSFSNVGR